MRYLAIICPVEFMEGSLSAQGRAQAKRITAILVKHFQTTAALILTAWTSPAVKTAEFLSTHLPGDHIIRRELSLDCIYTDQVGLERLYTHLVLVQGNYELVILILHPQTAGSFPTHIAQCHWGAATAVFSLLEPGKCYLLDMVEQRLLSTELAN